ncbi:acyltransferase GLAUCE-like [Andrographis paniculata]|uniref:acyltransferase GLAUCE-like n=1 Tax=Andrographis paniculata TaxID=175694 RepID=UPI0021E8AC44|nr:acyltransferase GLAUCE-like [Andrographis paniculata]
MINYMISLTDEDMMKEEPISLFSPANPIPTETIFLSNIDQAVTFPVETLFFYAAAGTADVAAMVRTAVERVLLVPYYFMAGRLRWSGDAQRLELVCNNSGVLFVSARTRVSLDDLGDLSNPNADFSRFVHRPGLYKSFEDTPIFTIQVTRFECGAFALGFMTNHAILDGKSASEMFHNLASICRGEGLKTVWVDNDRTPLKARTPPQIHFPHNEYLELSKTLSQPSSFTSQKRMSPSPLIFSNNYVHKLFAFSNETLAKLKNKTLAKCSTFEAILAHIWRARTRAYFDNLDQESTVLFAVDIRDKITPPLPEAFAGNAVITAFARARARDLIGRPLWFGVERVREGVERVTNEYIRSVIDWLEVHKGIPATGNGGAFYVSAWWKLTFGEVDLGFGWPQHAGPIVSGNDEFVLFLDDGNSGINVWLGLDKDKMDNFSSCVYQM